MGVNFFTTTKSTTADGVTHSYPTYGNYGGENYTSGRIGGAYDPSVRPIDALDERFMVHDKAYGDAAEQFPAGSAALQDALLPADASSSVEAIRKLFRVYKE